MRTVDGAEEGEFGAELEVDILIPDVVTEATLGEDAEADAAGEEVAEPEVPAEVAAAAAAGEALSTRNPTNKNLNPLVIFCPQWRNLPGKIRAWPR